MSSDLLEVVYANDQLAELDPAERRLALRSLLSDVEGAGSGTSLKYISDAIDGFGPLTELMTMPAVTDVLVNGPFEVWADDGVCLRRTDACFSNEGELRSLVDRLLGRAGARVDDSHPIADARLPDGSRMNVVVPPVAAHVHVSIRRFPESPLTIEDLHRRGTLTDGDLEILSSAVGKHKTIAISGGTGCGKTTLMNALLGLVPSCERVVTIEQTPELKPACDNRVSLLAREPNSEGRGAVSQQDLVRASLRMRPDRIVIGEVRGAEALAALSSMSVGHEGSMVTIHARSAAGVVPRFVTLALQAGSGASEESLRRQTLDSFDLFVHMQRDGGKRKVVEITDPNRMS